MGVMDKVKYFMGGHGVTVTHTTIERLPPEEAILPFGDTVLEGTFTVKTVKPCEVLSMRTTFFAEKSFPDGHVEELFLGQAVYPHHGVSRTPDMLQYPYTLEAGGSTDDGFIITLPEDIPTLLTKRGWESDGVHFFVKTMVDVKGSPFDPEAKDEIIVQV